MYKRSHTCGDLRKSNLDQEAKLNGWVNTVRLHGQVVFIDLRDRYGITQLVFNADSYKGKFELIKKLSVEDVLSIKGLVRLRESSAVNYNIKTGEIEVVVSDYIMLNEAAPLPFVLNNRDNSEDDLRLKYRYLELRMEELKDNILTRHEAYQATRSFLSNNNFVEVETPVLMKSTPEGARDYLVPSRVHKGKFYALPQSPQIYKQILMISGYDRYFQIVKCFRDEDLRADRQPEFTQIDIEMSFVDEEDIFFNMEKLTRHIFKEVKDINLPDSFNRLTYQQAMELYGSDKPDLRYEMPLIDLKNFTDDSDFNAFKSVDRVKGIMVRGGSKYSRKKIDELTDLVKNLGANGLAWVKIIDGVFDGGISKFFSDNLQNLIIDKLDAKNNDIIFMVGGDSSIVLSSLGRLRTHIAEAEELADKNEFVPVWITEFPMFEYDENEKLIAMHHPFTAPRDRDIKILETEPLTALSRGYDLTMNGYEIAGGSIRIHSSELQKKVLTMLGLSHEEAIDKFGFLVDSLSYGAPPHGGIAFGFDRIVMLLAGTDNIRDVIAFPKTTSATSLMDGSPSTVGEKQLLDLGIGINK